MAEIDSAGVTAALNKIKRYIDAVHYGTNQEEAGSDTFEITFKFFDNQGDSTAWSDVITDGLEDYPLPKSDNWMSLLKLKPCILRNGQVVTYLDINDYTKDTNGNTVDLTVLGDDVMLEIPRMGYRIEPITGRDNYRFTISNDVSDPSLDFSAFSLDDYGDCDKLYYGVYKSYVEGDKMYSTVGKIPTGGHTLDEMRTYARARGTGYIDVSFAADELLQILFCMTVQNTNGQTAIGVGHTGASSAAENLLATGGSETYGPFMQQSSAATAKTTNVGYHAKCLGIEDPWGNIDQLLDGFIKSAVHDTNNFDILRAKCASDFNSTGEGYVNVGTVVLKNYLSSSGIGYGYTTRMTMQQGAVFLPLEKNGYSNTNYCDYGYWRNILTICSHGGNLSSGSAAGPFYCNMISQPTDAFWNSSSRLMYLHKEQTN
jgi:hypothetical protein